MRSVKNVTQEINIFKLAASYMLLPRQHCFCLLLKCVSLLSVVVTSARTLPWLDVYSFGTGSAGASETLAGDQSSPRRGVFLLPIQRFSQNHWAALDLSPGSSIQEGSSTQPHLDLAAASEVMSPEALSLRWSTFWGFFGCHWSLQGSSVFPQKQDLSWLAWSAIVWTCPGLRLACGDLWWDTGLGSCTASCSLSVFLSQGSGPPRQIGLTCCLPAPCGMPLYRPCISSFYSSFKFAPYFFPSNCNFNYASLDSSNLFYCM